MNSFDKRLRLLRIVAWLEGLSYLYLLFVAMPLKYIADQPAMVKYSGMVHGLLFVLFTLNTVQAKIEQGWSTGRMMRVIGTSLIPFGMVMFDRILREPERKPA